MGRYMGSRRYDYISNAHVTLTARQPLPGIPFALVGEAYQSDYQGWMEASLLTAQTAVLQHVAVLDGMDKATRSVFHHIYTVLPGTNSSQVSDASRTSSFAIIPPLYSGATPPIQLPSKFLLPNEFWWPRPSVDEFKDDSYDYCSASQYKLGQFVLVE